MDYTSYAVDKIRELVSIPSPTGMTDKASDTIAAELKGMGLHPLVTRKGTVICALGGQGHPLLLSAHADTLGAIVRAVKPDGTLRYAHIGGFSDQAVENENCLIHTLSGKTYTGTIRPVKASRHVYTGEEDKRNDETMAVTVDELTACAEDTKRLGIAAGDYISFEPRFTLTDTGFIKSRHLDDKASAGLLLALAKAVTDGKVALGRETHLMFTVYEEVGHGASATLPDGIEDMIAVDMGCVGDDLNGKETHVSICFKDSAGPFHYGLTTRLVKMAEEAGCQYARDVFPSYASDTAAALAAGLEARYAVIGPGVYASHCYERTHVRALENTLKLLFQVIGGTMV